MPAKGSGKITPDTVIRLVGPCQHANPIPTGGDFPCRACRKTAYMTLPDFQEKAHAAAAARYQKDPEKYRHRSAAYRAKQKQLNPEMVKLRYKRERLGKYGLSIEQYNAMLAAQGNVCAICRRDFKGNKDCHVDHDHLCCPEDARSCGHCVRGLICSGCNNGLGLFRDDPNLLLSAIKYLRANGKHKFGIPFMADAA